MIRAGLYLSLALALLDPATGIAQDAAGERTTAMARTCVQNHPETGPTPEWDAEEVARLWGDPLDPDLLLIGGVDSYGWVRACRVEGGPLEILAGEYRDRVTWYRGRFRLQDPQGDALPGDVLDRFYVSHYSPGEGLVLYPLAETPPPVPHLLLVPLDDTGFAAPPPG